MLTDQTQMLRTFQTPALKPPLPLPRPLLVLVQLRQRILQHPPLRRSLSLVRTTSTLTVTRVLLLLTVNMVLTVPTVSRRVPRMRTVRC